MNILNTKSLRLDYTNEVINVIKHMAINEHNIKVVGSMSYKSFLYPNDYDCYEVISSNFTGIARKWKANVKALMNMKNVYVGDIKCGELNKEPIRWKPSEIIQGYKMIEGINEVDKSDEMPNGTDSKLN